MNVLIVEDNQDLSIELADFLDVKECKADICSSLAEMETRLTHDPYHIVLLDLGLPDGDGLDHIDRIRKRFGDTLGIIVLTARGRPADRADGVSQGADYYLVKPVYLPELWAVMIHIRSRLSHGSPSRSGWQLTEDNILIEPDGKRCCLTGSEALLVRALAGSPDIISRDDLCEHVFSKGLYEAIGTRRLDTLISRLRTKVLKETGKSFPIQTYRNKGFSASEPILAKF